MHFGRCSRTTQLCNFSHRHLSPESRKLEAESRNCGRNSNHWLRSRRVMSRLIRWSMVLLAMLVPIIKVASAAIVEAPTRTAAWGISGNTSADGCRLSAGNLDTLMIHLPLEDTPAPISISGSSITIPPSSARPPVPPCSAVKAHLRSASVSLEMGITLMPV
jgi:hypothetical protein